MGEQATFERILESVHDAMLDDTHWPRASALIDAACGLTGNAVMVGEGPKDDVRPVFIGSYCRGQRREDLEHEYLGSYHASDERVPRFRRLPDSRLVHVKELYTADELKTSPTYNELLPRGDQQNSLVVRLDGPDGSHITWGLGDPVDAAGWASSRVGMVRRLLPHIRQFVRVRQALVRADARSTTVTALPDNRRIGVLHLDRRGRILEANDRARSILRHGDGLSDREGALGARAAADQACLERLIGDALPGAGPAPVSGSMLLRRSHVSPPFVVHVKPASVPQPDYGARHVAVVVLIAEPGRPSRVNPDLVATILGLTPAESHVAVCLAEGKSVRDIAEATGRSDRSIYWHVQQIYKKQSISRQADLVRLVLSLAELD